MFKGLASKHRDRPYQSGRSKHWIKVNGCWKSIAAAERKDGPQPTLPQKAANCTNPFEPFAAGICPLKIKV